jgi:N-acetylneuraminic acid mutarotase
MVYDKKLKKTVLFGGYGTSNYFDETWLWDGTNWTEVDDGEKPDHRGLAMLWYDPLQEKTILYGGIGRANLDQKVTRYDDMWSFNGNEWTKMSVSQTPGERLGAQIAINPNTGKLLLMGGLRAESDDKGKILRQYFANDTWEWNGAANAWTELHPDRAPDTRENGMMAWDPLTNEIVVFGGYSYGFYRSDVWAWNGQTWRPLVDEAGRRRASNPAPPPEPPTND